MWKEGLNKMIQGVVTALSNMIYQSPSFSHASRHFTIKAGILREENDIKNADGHILTMSERQQLVELVCKKLSKREIPLNGEIIINYQFSAVDGLENGSILINNNYSKPI